MFPVIEKLLILQDRDQKIRAIQTELKVAPSEKLSLEKKLLEEQAAFDVVKEKSQKLEMERKKLEMDAESKRNSIERFKTQQAQTRKNEEYQTLTAEIARHEQLVVGIEDQELELMEQVEAARAQVNEASKILQAAKTAIANQLKDIDAKIEVIKARQDELEKERAAFAEEINDKDLLFFYDRLLKSKGDAAVVPVEHEVCRGCHIKITTQTGLKVRAARELVNCENCGRILYEE